MWAAIGRGEGEGTRWLGDEGIVNVGSIAASNVTAGPIKVMLQVSLILEGSCC
jgi:hypothetical protein